MKRPTANGYDGSYCTTPGAVTLMSICGCALIQNGVAISSDEKHYLDRLYGFVPEPQNDRPPKPTAPKRTDFPTGYAGEHKYDDACRAHELHIASWEKWKDPRPWMQAGADRNVMRHASADGLRLIAWLAKYIEPGTDPLKMLVAIAAASGWDVDPYDVEWAECSEEGEEE